MQIFLIGFMGSGKTTLGKKLARKLGFRFTDLDHEFEAAVGMSIPEYFSTFGETVFREKEKEILQSSERGEKVVIATGGGAPCYFDNMEWMNSKGLTIYIQLPAQALADRLESADTERPVLQNFRAQALVGFIEQKLEEREPYYLQARLSVKGISLSAENLAAQIQEYLV